MPGLGDLAPVLQRLAEREAEVIAILQRRCRRRLLGAHARDLLVAEAIGLEVGQAPIGVAEIGPGRRRRAIGLDRLRDPADRLQRMAEPQVHVRRFGRVGQHVPIERDRLVMFSQTDGDGGRKGAVVRIARLQLQQPLDLFAGLRGICAASVRVWA